MNKDNHSTGIQTAGAELLRLQLFKRKKRTLHSDRGQKSPDCSSIEQHKTHEII